MYVVIAGGGKVGSILAERLLATGHEVALVEERARTVAELQRDLRGRYMVIQGDCCDAQILGEAGMRAADLFVCATGHDDVNLTSAEIADTVYKPPHIIARVNNPKNNRIFQKLGIDTISTSVLIARVIEEAALSSQVRTVMSLRQGDHAGGGFEMLEVLVTESAALQEQGGVRASDVSLPEGSMLVAVSHGGRYEMVGPATVVQPGSSVLLVVQSGAEDAARRAIQDL